MLLLLQCHYYYYSYYSTEFVNEYNLYSFKYLLLLFFFSHPLVAPGGSDEPRRHPPPQRETPRSGGQLPARLTAQAGRRHHAVQPAQALEHHGEAGTRDQARARDAEERPLS